MADRVYNINDYRKGANGDTIDNIRIEDPLDFLDASEKEAYIHERRREETEKLKRREEAEKQTAAAARDLSERERARIKRETDDPLGERPARKPRPDPYEEDEQRERRSARKAEPARRRPPVPDEDEEEDDDDEDDSRGLLIASGIMGILIVLVLVFMLWLRFFMPVPEEPEAEERAIQEAQIGEEETETSAQEESAGESEALAAILAQGFTERADTVTTTTALNMRSAPDSTQDNKVTTVPEGTALQRVAENSLTGWSAVEVPGYDEILYCSTKYLKTE